MADDSSSSEESESDVDMDQVTKKTGERGEESKAGQTQPRPSADNRQSSPSSPVEATRPLPSTQQEEQVKPNVAAQPDVDTDDLLEELLALPSDVDATATATSSGSPFVQSPELRVVVKPKETYQRSLQEATSLVTLRHHPPRAATSSHGSTLSSDLPSTHTRYGSIASA
jgi:hypothetical protein